jgi:hypothetical protein
MLLLAHASICYRRDVPLNLAVVLSHPSATNHILSMPVGSVFPLRSQFAAMAKSEDDRILRDDIGKLHGVDPTKQDSDSMSVYSPFSCALGWAAAL